MLEFNEEEHRYTWDGTVVPGVTTVLKPLSNYDMVPQHIMEKAAARGHAVHLATELHDEGTLDEESMDPTIKPYLDAWKMFRETQGYGIVVSEARVFSEKGMYAGTLDRILEKKGHYYLGDIKSTFAHIPTVGPQTAAYQKAWEEVMGIKIKGRLSIRLKTDGHPEVTELNNRSDLAIFNNCLAIYKWRAQHYG